MDPKTYELGAKLAGNLLDQLCLTILAAALVGERGNNEINNEMVVDHAAKLLDEIGERVWK